MMNICVVGAGGREHALAETLARTADVVVTPGNAGIAHSVDTDPAEVDADLFVIGPEGPLADGLADRLRRRGVLVLGPGADGAALEGSKAWMKEVVTAAGVPTADHRVFDASPHSRRAAHEWLDAAQPPYVVKTDGLAGGKGVQVTDDLAAAHRDVDAKLDGHAFGDAGRRLVIEEGLTGPEISVFAVCDGRRAVLIPTAARDYKRLADGDAGPNTGGMGCFSPVPEVCDALLAELSDTALTPTLAELQRRGIDYRGVLYGGFILTADGPRLLEFNVRFGDPEAQVVLPRLTGDVAALCASAAAGEIVGDIEVSSDAMVCVVCAAPGYPSAPRTGDLIDGLSAARALPGVSVYCSGVASDAVLSGAVPSGAVLSGAVASRLVTSGGRVLNVCGRGPDLATARQRAYAAVERISWPAMKFRRDIAAEAALL